MDPAVSQFGSPPSTAMRIQEIHAQGPGAIYASQNSDDLSFFHEGTSIQIVYGQLKLRAVMNVTL